MPFQARRWPLSRLTNMAVKGALPLTYPFMITRKVSESQC